jgi:hypothetical protein
MSWNRKSFGELREKQPAQNPSDPAEDTFAAHTGSANATKAQRLKASKSSRATTFQQSFFEELEQIPADTLSQLMERARGKLRECVEAYWRYKKKKKRRAVLESSTAPKGQRARRKGIAEDGLKWFERNLETIVRKRAFNTLVVSIWWTLS